MQPGSQPELLSHRRFLRLVLKRIVQVCRRAATLTAESMLILLCSGGLLLRGLNLSFASGQLVINGVPLSIIAAFLRDKIARRAYFRQNRRALHDRLWAMGIEEQIKDFYRHQISDEIELDRYIHQLLYDRTGYVGRDYQVNTEGTLLLKAKAERIG